MRIRSLTIVVAVIAFAALSASPALAHDCFNPTKNAHAPTAGVHYTLVGFDANGPIFVQTGQARASAASPRSLPACSARSDRDAVCAHDRQQQLT